MTTWRGVVAVALAGIALSVPVVSVTSASGGPPLRKLGKPEGKLILLQWPLYSHPSFAGDFERSTGCKITSRDAASSADMVDLMRHGPFNVGLIPAWKSLARPFQSPVYNTVKGVHYGVTVMWTPSELLYNVERAKPAPASWRAVYDDRFRGKVSIPDNPMQIADAALYLGSRDKRLTIHDPYELTPSQFDAAVALLRRQRGLVVRYWQYASEQIQDFRTNAAVVGSSWPYQVQVLQTSDVPVRKIVPSEGATAWADSWLLAKRATHPNCAYLWLRYVSTATVQAQMALFLRESPVNRFACPLMDQVELGSCAAYYGSSPPRLLGRLAFWKTPVRACGWGGRRDCVPYAAWQRAWAKIRS
jgi:putative spermidine/putrescine transport system substrate-binding protein